MMIQVQAQPRPLIWVTTGTVTALTPLVLTDENGNPLTDENGNPLTG